MQLKRMVEFEDKSYIVILNTNGTERLPVGLCKIIIFDGKRGLKLYSTSIPTRDFDFIEITKEAFREFKALKLAKYELIKNVIKYNQWNGEIKL